MGIETILFRVSAMLQGGRHLVFGLRGGSPKLLVPRPTGKYFRELSGTVGYSAYVANSAEMAKRPPHRPNPGLAVYLTKSELSSLPSAKPEGFFITKSVDWNLWDHLPRAIAKIYAVATTYQCVRSCDTRPFFSGCTQDVNRSWRHQQRT